MRIFVVLFLGALSFLGCGKSSEQKKAEADLSGQIMNIHRYSMAAMQRIRQIDDSLDAALGESSALFSSRRDAGPDTLTSKLRTGKEALARANASMDEWMQAYRPYDQSGNHDEVMAELGGQKEHLARSTADALAAIDTASTALMQFREFTGKLTRKPVTRH